MRLWHLYTILTCSYGLFASTGNPETTPPEADQAPAKAPTKAAIPGQISRTHPTPQQAATTPPLHPTVHQPAVTPPKKPTEPTDEKVTVFNATPVTISIRYERIGNPGIIESIKSNSMITITRNPNAPMIYSLESGGQNTPITPDMIVHGQITIKVPPEFMQSFSGMTTTTTGTAPTPPAATPPGTPEHTVPPTGGNAAGIIPQLPPAGKK